MGSLDVAVAGGAPNLLGSLTAAARLLPENADWEAFGVSYVPENCGFPWVWQACTVGEKPLNPGVDAVEFKPFLVEYNAQSCAGIPGDWQQYADRAKRGLAVRAGNAIDFALSSSAPDGQPNDSPSLPTTATDVTPGGGPASILNTVSGLIQEAYACGATGELFIHAPAWTLPHWLASTLLTQVGLVFKLGPHTVVLDQGYANEEPTGGVPAGTGEAWIYVSGPVEYQTGSIQILEDTTKGVSPRLNRANVIAAQLAIYRFDPCCIYAALAKVC